MHVGFDNVRLHCRKYHSNIYIECSLNQGNTQYGNKDFSPHHLLLYTTITAYKMCRISKLCLHSTKVFSIQGLRAFLIWSAATTAVCISTGILYYSMRSQLRRNLKTLRTIIIIVLYYPLLGVLNVHV